jgi:hypothetical protein
MYLLFSEEKHIFLHFTMFFFLRVSVPKMFVTFLGLNQLASLTSASLPHMYIQLKLDSNMLDLALHSDCLVASEMTPYSLYSVLGIGCHMGRTTTWRRESLPLSL